MHKTIDRWPMAKMAGPFGVTPAIAARLSNIKMSNLTVAMLSGFRAAFDAEAAGAVWRRLQFCKG